MSHKLSILVPSPAPGPPTTRHEPPPTVHALQAAFRDKVADQDFIHKMVHDMVEAASRQHVMNVLEDVAVDYTACALWAEMVALVKSSVVPHDAGYRSAAEIAAAEGRRTQATDIHDPWKSGDPPARIPSEENSRRFIDVRPQANRLDSSQSQARARRRQHGDSLMVEDANARALLHGLRSGSVSTAKPGSRGSVDLSRATAVSPSTRLGATARQSKQGVGGKSAATTSGNAEPPHVETLQQHDLLTDDGEILAHQEMLARAAAEREDAIRRQARISKALTDPKAAPKHFTIDVSGNVIPVGHVDEAKAAALAEQLSPRFVVPANQPPQTDTSSPTTAKRSSPRGGGASVAGATEKKKSSAREAKKDDQFVTVDARDFPMQIKVAPAGGVLIKDNGPPRAAELKTPASKMSKLDFAKLRGGSGVQLDNFGLGAPLLDDSGGSSTPKPTGGVPSANAPASSTGASESGAAPSDAVGSTAVAGVGVLPVKRGNAQSGAGAPRRSLDVGAAPNSARGAGTKSPLQPSPPPQGSQSARVNQRLAVPPNRSVVTQSTVASKKTVITKCTSTPLHSQEADALAHTWDGQREVAKERDRERVVVTLGRWNEDEPLSETL